MGENRLIPLFIPEGIKQRNECLEFFLDYFGVGYASKCRASIREQLLKRTEQLYSVNYTDIETKKISEEVAKIICMNLDWPNANYLPEDPCELLFFEKPLGLESCNAIIEIERLYKISDLDYFEKTFSELIEIIKQEIPKKRGYKITKKQKHRFRTIFWGIAGIFLGVGINYVLNALEMSNSLLAFFVNAPSIFCQWLWKDVLEFTFQGEASLIMTSLFFLLQWVAIGVLLGKWIQKRTLCCNNK